MNPDGHFNPNSMPTFMAFLLFTVGFSVGLILNLSFGLYENLFQQVGKVCNKTIIGEFGDSTYERSKFNDRSLHYGT